MRALLSLAFLVSATPAFANIGDTLDIVKSKHGAVAPIHRDRFSASYAFKVRDVIVEIVLTPTVVSRINVFFPKAPQDTAEALLERFSGRSGWKSRRLADPEFVKQFPGYSASDSTNQFYAAGEAYALMKPDSSGAKLMLLIQTSGFVRHADEAGKNKK